MEPCVDLYRGPSVQGHPSAIHRWWFLASGLVACQRGVPLPDSSVAHSVCRADPSHVARPCFGFQGSITFPLSSSPAGTSG